MPDTFSYIHRLCIFWIWIWLDLLVSAVAVLFCMHNFPKTVFIDFLFANNQSRVLVLFVIPKMRIWRRNMIAYFCLICYPRIICTDSIKLLL